MVDSEGLAPVSSNRTAMSIQSHGSHAYCLCAKQAPLPSVLTGMTPDIVHSIQSLHTLSGTE